MTDQIESLRTLLSKRGITHQEAAWKIGVTEATLSRWLTGKFNPSKHVIHKIEAYISQYNA